jgi:hypothetical protein
MIKQFPAQGLMPPLDLPRRGRRPGPGEPLGDAVLPADPLEQHLDRCGRVCRPVNCLPLSDKTSNGTP